MVVRANRTLRGRPAFAASQRQKILELLRAAGVHGVSRATLIFEHRMTQCGARVDELKHQGHEIVSELRDGEQYVRHVLKTEPLDLRPIPDGAGWYERQTGKSRPHDKDDLPLFAGGDR
jgi:hypothetical protein